MNSRVFKFGLSSGLLLSSFVVQAAPSHAESGFSDIEGSFAKDAILELLDKGIINGKGDGKFDPRGNMTREQFAKVMALALKLDTTTPPSTPSFKDIDTTNWSYSYVEAAVKAGLINGHSDGTFGHSEKLSREQMAAILVRALGVDATGYGEKLNFTDSDKISDYAKDSVGYALELGLIKGKLDGSFDPRGTATREAVAMVATSFLEKKKEIDESQQPPEPEPTPDPEPNPHPRPEDTTPPRAVKVSMESGNSSPQYVKLGDVITFQIETSESVQTPSLKVNGHSAINMRSDDRIHWQAEYVISETDEDGELSFTLDMKDMAGNNSSQITSVTTGNTVIIDKTPPILTGVNNDDVVESATPMSSDTDISSVELKSDRDKNGEYETLETYSGLNTAISSAGRYQLSVIDHAGNSSVVKFKVNHKPVVSQPITDRDGAVVNEEMRIDISSLFSDIDNDGLLITAASSSPDTADITSEPDGDFLYLTFNREGTVEITITADDQEGGTTTETFTVTTNPVNHAPTIADEIDNQVLTVGYPVNFDLTSIFSDEDGDELSFEAVSSNNDSATVTEEDGILTIDPTGVGTSTVTVTANDGKGGMEELAFTADVKDEMVLHLAFDGNVTDSSTYANNGVVDYGNVSYVDGIIGEAIQFKGTDDPGRIKVVNNPSLQFTNKFTIAYWLRVDDSKGQEGNFGHYVNPGIQSVFSKDTDNSKLNSLIFMSSADNGSVRFDVAEASVTKGVWAHIAFVIDGNKIVKYYNGQFVNEMGKENPFSFTTANTKDLYIGYQGNGWYPLYGTLDDLRIYKDALTSDEIQQLYQLGQSI
ncbi:S-layer homology domain-containing protein [Falsibacillus pallidus]|uniref:S-layer homology domain-containing protein n=1 Tax=Falsibacillus pallidus TaxID=493781 RepID=UPI003D989E4C